mmetsp:Transcript_31387/g.40361  ORF Transcript_31387/g.40361 Transcript_31387/m.40361 type:complete len:697 (-) Transcript_31387:114-2204(-)
MAADMEEVRQLLQPMFAKPVLKDQLLSKPPFRFVHDVVSGVTKATGFADGLYADRPDLVDAKAVKEKQAKLDFIDRIVLCVGNFQGYECDIKAGKVVAGLEPEKTNKFFIALGKAAKGASADASALAVKRAIANEQPDPAFANGGGGGAKDEGGAKEEGGMDAKAESPGPDSAQAKPPPSRGGGQRNSATKEEVAPRAGGNEVMGHDEGPSYEQYTGECNGEIETTIQMMGALIAKPKMTEKLLSKPPFRFLHDVMMAVTDTTGFGTGLLEESEKDGKVLSKASKEEKIEFLEKVKQLVGYSLNTMVEARPAKIVAGLEHENTNRLLQLLAVAAKHCPDSEKAVAMVRGGGPPPAASEPAPAAAEPAPALRERKAEEPPQPNVAAPKDPEPEAAPAPAKDDGGGAKDSEGGGSGASSAVGGGGSASGSKPTEDEAKGGDDEGGDFLDAEPKRSMRPTTARRRPPKVKENVRQLEQSGVGGGGGASGGAPKGADHIIADGADDLDSDEEAEAKAGGSLGGFGVVADLAEGASNLVREIENEARGAVNQNKNGQEEKDGGNDNKQGGIRLGRIKKTEASKAKKSMSSWSEADIEQLRVSVQRLCQSTNPLGKCMDFVHEDLSAMSKEYERWQTEYRTKVEQLEREKKVTEESLQPLHLRLLELNEQHKESVSKIGALKAKVAKNDSRIEQILQLVVQI